MVLILSEVNERIGFWRAWAPMPEATAYLWRCGCCGVSDDGYLVAVSVCGKHASRDMGLMAPMPEVDEAGIRRICSEAFRHLGPVFSPDRRR
jgi:hypothetical protein